MSVLARSSVLAQVPRELHTLKHFARAMVTGLNPHKLFAGGLWRGTDVSTVRAFLERLGCPPADCGIHIVFRFSINNEIFPKGNLVQGVLKSCALFDVLKSCLTHMYTCRYAFHIYFTHVFFKSVLCMIGSHTHVVQSS
jgi:hypothetical protein